MLASNTSNTTQKALTKLNDSGKRVIFVTGTTRPKQEGAVAPSKYIGGEPIAVDGDIKIDPVPPHLSHLVPLVKTLNDRNKKRPNPTVKRPATFSGKVGTNRSKNGTEATGMPSAPKVKTVKDRHA